MIKVVSRPFLGKKKYKDFRLCYIDSISETVYEQTPESKAWERTAEYRAIKVPFYVRHDWCDVKLPMDYGCGNSPFCVRDINAGAVAWVFARGLEEKSIDGIAIQAGVNPYEFFERVDKINEMYPYVPEGNEDE